MNYEIHVHHNNVHHGKNRWVFLEQPSHDRADMHVIWWATTIFSKSFNNALKFSGFCRFQKEFWSLWPKGGAIPIYIYILHILINSKTLFESDKILKILSRCCRVTCFPFPFVITKNRLIAFSTSNLNGLAFTNPQKAGRTKVLRSVKSLL